MPHVVGDHQRRRARVALGLQMLGGMAEKADGGADERVVVEDVAADGRVLRRAHGADLALLGGRRDAADGAPAHAAGAEGEIAIETVVQLGPVRAGYEFPDAVERPGGQAGVQPGVEILDRGGKKVGAREGRLEGVG